MKNKKTIFLALLILLYGPLSAQEKYYGSFSDTIIVPQAMPSDIAPEILAGKAYDFLRHTDEMFHRYKLDFESQESSFRLDLQEIEQQQNVKWNVLRDKRKEIIDSTGLSEERKEKLLQKWQDELRYLNLETNLKIKKAKQPYYIKDAGEIFLTLDRVSTKRGIRLGLVHALQCDMGDASYFFTYHIEDSARINPHDFNDTTSVKRFQIEEYLTARPDPMAAWQIYLLHESVHAIPCWWHACYNQNTYIFRLEDLEKIHEDWGLTEQQGSPFTTKPYSRPNEKTNLLPSVSKKRKNVYLVRCCYWNSWEGLVAQTVEITFSQSRITYRVVSLENLYKFNSGIMF